jgi:hypothetical protein
LLFTQEIDHSRKWTMGLPLFKKPTTQHSPAESLSVEACLYKGRIEGTGFQSNYLLEIRLTHPAPGPLRIRKVVCSNAGGTPYPRLELDFTVEAAQPRFDGLGKVIVLNLPVPNTYLGCLKEGPASVQITTCGGDIFRVEVNRAALL